MDISVQRIARAFKRGALRAFRTAGGYSLVAGSDWRRNRLLILCYHGISIEEEHGWRPSLFMSRPDFAERMRLLAAGRHNVLPFGEAVQRLYDGDLPERSVAITVDDGNFDFLSQAMPVLQQHGYPATVYLHSYYCLHQYPVFRLICSYVLWKRRGRVLSTSALTGEMLTLDLRTEAGREAVVDQLRGHAKRVELSPAGRDALAEALANVVGVDYAALREKRVLQIMSEAEVEHVAAAGFDVQLHTHRHISPRNEERYRSQIRENREIVERLAGRPAVHFCYPSGNHAPEFLPWLESERVVTATTCTPGIASRADHPLLLPRLIDHDQLSDLEFTGWLSGAAEFLPRRTYVSRDAVKQ